MRVGKRGRKQIQVLHRRHLRINDEALAVPSKRSVPLGQNRHREVQDVPAHRCRRTNVNHSTNLGTNLGTNPGGTPTHVQYWRLQRMEALRRMLP